jgi:hypothetical protein
LRDEEFFGRFPEAPVFHDADEVAELTDIHGGSIEAKAIGYPYDRYIQTVFPPRPRFTYSHFMPSQKRRPPGDGGDSECSPVERQ